MMNKFGVSSGAKRLGAGLILFLLSGLTAAHVNYRPPEIVEMSDIRVREGAGERTIILEFTGAVNYRSFTLRNPPRVVLDIPGVILKEPRAIEVRIEVRNEMIETISYKQHQPDTVRVVVNLTQPAESQVQKVGRELQLHLSLPREMRARSRAERRARQLLVRRVKRETEIKAREAAAEKERALEIARREAGERERQLEIYLSRGERHFRTQRFDTAIQEFKAALILDPGNEGAQDYLILAREGKEAQLLAQRVAEYLSQGREYYLRGCWAEAIFKGEKVLALSPDNRRAEDLIRQSRRQVLERDKERAREERELVEARRMLDVTRAPFTSPVDYADTIDLEKRVIAREEVTAIREAIREEEAVIREAIREEEAVRLRRKAAETLVTMSFRDADIVDVLFFLSELSRITIAVDRRAIDELVDPRVSIFTPTEIPLTAALDIILRVKGLEHVIKEHYIWVAEVGRAEEPVARVHWLRYGIRTIREVAPILEEEEEEQEEEF